MLIGLRKGAKAMSEYVGELKLKEPFTKKDWEIIADTDFKHTPKVTFTTPHCGEVEFVKVVRCKECKHPTDSKYERPFGFMYRCGGVWHGGEWYCPLGKRREDDN